MKMKDLTQKIMITALAVITFVGIAFTCFAIDRKTGDANTHADYEALSGLNYSYIGPVLVSPVPVLR
jgi:formate/nitrite transporter FocA (FNT family)